VQAFFFILSTEYKPFINVSKSESLIFFMDHQGEFVKAVLVGFSQGLMSKEVLAQYFYHAGLKLNLIIGASVILVGMIYFVRWLRMECKPILPIFLMAFSIIAIMGAIPRVQGFGVEAMFWPRYIRYFSPYILGLVLLVLHEYKHKGTLRLRILLILIGFFSVNYIVAAVYQYKRLPMLQSNIMHVEQELKRDKAYSVNMAPYCRTHDCQPVWEFLNTNRLSVFKTDATSSKNISN
jgi:hypothetical protein